MTVNNQLLKGPTPNPAPIPQPTETIMTLASPLKKSFYEEWKVQIWAAVLAVVGAFAGNTDRLDSIFESVNLASKTYIDSRIDTTRQEMWDLNAPIKADLEKGEQKCGAKFSQLAELIRDLRIRVTEVEKIQAEKASSPTVVPSNPPVLPSNPPSSTADDIKIKVDE